VVAGAFSGERNVRLSDPAPPSLPYTAVHDPGFISAGDAKFMNDEDRVIGLMSGKTAKAYPPAPVAARAGPGPIAERTNRDHLVKLTATRPSFRAEAKGQPLVLDNAGVVAGNEVFKDRGRAVVGMQSSLEAISGPLQGARLQLYPFLLTSWQEWRRLHPDTLVLKLPLPGYADRIAEKNRMIPRGLSGEGAGAERRHVSR
jgi:hypothetical protein